MMMMMILSSLVNILKLPLIDLKQNSDLVMLKQCLQYQVYLMNKYNQPQEMEVG